ncbi:MAG TPA: response regulator transcription factor [Paludibacter sp.]|nr:response regulator transcription factor [Paludibacter sp.]
MNRELKIMVVEPSVIVRSGMAAVLKRIPGFRIQPIEIQTFDSLSHYLDAHKPDVLIVNPVYWGLLNIEKVKTETGNPGLICLALANMAVDPSLLRPFDDTVGIFDSIEQLKNKLEKLIDSQNNEVPEETNTLSQREKEIVTCVVKGLTNKEIADTLFLSTHTVISHRRNIARKLEIHSTAGLTIYAIVNKLVELDELKKP